MTDWTPTGTDEDLDEILRCEYACTRSWEAWQVGTMTVDDFTPLVETEMVGDLIAWRDAAVARFLAEAGAVHPAVHTPTRVMQWLEQHGWERDGGSDVAMRWRHALGGPSFMDVWVPMNPEAIDYARRVRDVLQDGTLYDGTPLSRVLAEVAAESGEWSW